MAKVTKDNSAGGFINIDDGMYKAVVSDIEEGEAKQKRAGQSGTFLRWKFKIIDPEMDQEIIDDEVVLSGISPAIATDKNKLGTWLLACGIQLEDGDSMDTDDICGTTVRVLVKTTVDKKDAGKEYCNVVDVLRAKKKKKKVVEEDDDDDEEEVVEKKEKKSKKKKTDKKPKKKSKKSKKKDEDEDEEEDEDESPPEDDEDEDEDLFDELDDGDDD